MATTTTGRPRDKAAVPNQHRFSVVFLVIALLTMRLPPSVSMPVALGVATVAEAPSVIRLLLGIVLATLSAAVYFWQQG